MASMPKKQIEAVPVEESVAADTDRPANGSDRVAFQEGLFHVRALNRHGAVRQTPLVTRDGQRGQPFVGRTIDGPFRPILSETPRKTGPFLPLGSGVSAISY